MTEVSTMCVGAAARFKTAAPAEVGGACR
jgi:hypothetical protein